MKITYTAPNRAHHYSYAHAMNEIGCLSAFVSGFSRFSPRSNAESLGNCLKRWDHVQNVYLAALKVRAPQFVEFSLNQLSNRLLDAASYHYAKSSDVFLYYRTTGLKTTKRLKREGLRTVSVLEEVNTHVDECFEILSREYEEIGLGKLGPIFADHSDRLDAYQDTDFILCPSEFVRGSFLRRGFDPARIIKLNFGFTPRETFSSGSESRNGTFRLLFVGQINFRKGLRYAIHAFRRLRYSKKELIIVGPRTLITGLEKCPIPDGVTFTGVLKGTALKRQFESADAFVLPTLEEGLALVIGEAMTFGLPIITTSSSGAEDIMTHGEEGLILRPCDSTALTNSFEMLLDSPQMRKQMAAASWKASKTLANWRDTTRSLINELHRLQKAKTS